VTLETLSPLRSPLAAVQHVLERLDNQGVIIGGIAASVLGSPRLTADVDCVVLMSLSRLPELLTIAAEADLAPRIENAEQFARRHRVLLLVHLPSGVAVDLSLAALPFEEEMIARSELYTIGELSLRLPTPEDLVITKAVAHRPKDLLDIAEILKSHPDLDLLRIEAWVKEFAAVLEMPQIWEDIQPLLGRVPDSP
jgi:hypothetical protein